MLDFLILISYYINKLILFNIGVILGINFVEMYENLSDNELAALSKQNDHDASVALLRRYMGLIKSRASYFYNGAIEMDDLVQEGIISLFLSVKNFSPEIASFSTFAHTCIDRGIISVIRSQALKKHIPKDKLVNIEDVNNLSTHASPEDIIIENEDVSTLEYNIKSVLSRLEYKVFLLYLHNYSRAETARQLDIPQKVVSNAIYRIKSKLKSL
jgi:RNA polymerase sporulation-specific sigma factor